MNRVVLVGRLVRDPDLRNTQSNQTVTSFTLAVDKSLSKQKKQELESQNRPTADFIRIVVWGPQAVNCERYLRKGSQCAVDGRIQTGSYIDKETGKTVYTTDIVAENVEFLGSRSDNQGGGSNYNQNHGDNQDYGNNDYSQTNYQNNYNNNSYNQNQGGFDSSDDFFDDDFTEIEDDGRIPF